MASLPTCVDADNVSFDARGHHPIYVGCSEGVMDVQRGGGSFRPRERVKTSFGARSVQFVPELDRPCVAERRGRLGSDAALLVLRLAL